MSHHFAGVSKFADLVKDTINKTEGKAYSIDNEEHRIELVSVLVHTMDLSGVGIMKFEIAHPWGLRCN